MSASTVLVTGASGFIASHCIRRLQEDGYKVRGTVRSLKNETKVAPLRKLCPNPKYELELVEANLTDDSSKWEKVVKGCDYILHVASPFPDKIPNDKMEIITPAVEGTLAVLRAAAAVGGVKRIVVTSSGAAVFGNIEPDYSKVYTEEDWTDLNKPMQPYLESKTLAEKAAWEFHESLTENKFELAVINPLYVMGPVIHGSAGTSQVLIENVMNGKVPMIPQLSFEVCDVRDVANAHIKAMTLPEAAGKRHIICDDECVKFGDFTKILSDEFTSQGWSFPTMTAPNFLFCVMSWFSTEYKQVTPRLGHKSLLLDNSRMKNVLGIQPTPIKDTVLSMAYSMIEKDIVTKKPGYKVNPGYYSKN